MTTLTAKEAKEIKIFYLEDVKIESGNLYDFIMESAEEATSPRGVAMKLHTRHIKEGDKDKNGNYLGEGEERWQVWTWGIRGQHPQFIDEFNTEEEAENEIFQRVYEHDFLSDDQRDIEYYHTIEDAEAVQQERLAEQ